MNSLRSPANRFSAWIQTCGLLFILIGMGLAQVAAMWNFIVHTMFQPSAGTILGGAAFYLMFAGAGLAGLRWIYRRGGRHTFLPVVLGASMLIQTSAILAADKQWKWSNDAWMFNHYLERLSTSGYTPEALGELSRNYDYSAWTHRAQPFYYALRVWTGDQFVRAAQFFQAFLVTLSLALTWRIAKILFGRSVAFWATSLQCLMPYSWFACLDLNHYIPGTFYFFAALWIVAEWSQKKRGLLGSWVLALLAGVAVTLMGFEGDSDKIYAVAVSLALVLLWAVRRQNIGQTVQSGVALLVWPLSIAAILLSPLSTHIDEANLYRLSSGTVAFMARGWMPETEGEYSGTYEQIDVLTPIENKQSVQASLLASQAYYNPQVLLFRLVPVKLAKYFLLGYASGAEEMLVHNGAETISLLAKGARSAYLLAVLPLMIWGGMLLLPLLRSTARLVLVLPCAIFCVATVLVGETSPRYSTYIHPFLFMLGALPLAWGARRRNLLRKAFWAPGLVAAGSIFLAFLLAIGILATARPWLRSHVFQDLRLWKIAADARASSWPSTLAPFEIQLLPQTTEAGTDWGTLEFTSPPDSPGTLSFYVIPSGASSAVLKDKVLLTEYITPLGRQTQTNTLPARISFEYVAATPGTLKLHTPTALPYSLSIGYVAYKTKKP